MAKKKPAKTGIEAALRAAIDGYPSTRYRLAKSAEITQPVLDRFMTGERDIRLMTADKLAKALGLALVRVADPIL